MFEHIQHAALFQRGLTVCSAVQCGWRVCPSVGCDTSDRQTVILLDLLIEFTVVIICLNNTTNSYFLLLVKYSVSAFTENKVWQLKSLAPYWCSSVKPYNPRLCFILKYLFSFCFYKFRLLHVKNIVNTTTCSCESCGGSPAVLSRSLYSEPGRRNPREGLEPLTRKFAFSHKTPVKCTSDSSFI